MNLPRPLLHRIRRAIRRQLMIPDRLAIRRIEEWAGHRPEPPTRKSMKPWLLILAVILALAYMCGLVGCTTVTTTAKDGSVTVTKAPAPGVLQFAGAAITAYSPRPIKVREEKSARITPEEIAKRWRPAKP